VKAYNNILCFLAFTAIFATAHAQQPTGDPPFDIVLKGGRIVDGTGNRWFMGDVAIRGDTIAAIGLAAAQAPARRTVDVTGLIVAPGFIDIHSHSDTTLLEDGSALSKIHQGVTTEVLGEDTSAGPAVGKRAAATIALADGPLSWTTLAGYFDTLEKRGVAVNVASYVGLGTLLECVQGQNLDRPDRQRLEQLKILLDEAMRDGAIGLSTMLASAREFAVKSDDLVELCRVVQKHGGIFSSHIRNEGTEVVDAVNEVIRVGREARVPVDIIHLKIADQSLWGQMDKIVAIIASARAAGVDVQANVYPYTRGNNDLVSIIPPWAHEGGRTELLGRLKDASLRARLKHDIKAGLTGWYNHYTAVGGDWSKMLVSAKLSKSNERFQGQTMDQIIAAKSTGRERDVDPLDVLFDFLIEEKGSVGTIYAHHTESDMNDALVQPWCSIGSDGYALATHGPLRRGHPHPRSFGTFPRVLGEYVRGRHLLTWEDAVRKMTALNAAKIGLRDRGLLRRGMKADLTVFDPATVADQATYLEPFQFSTGIVHVFVNGQPVVENGQPTAQKPGRALRHGRSTSTQNADPFEK
jgi:N-acyl-D-aspartate/D-glutamate deacylase